MRSSANRRSFLKFFGRAGMAAASASIIPSCLNTEPRDKSLQTSGLPFEPILPTDENELVLSNGFNYHVIAKVGDAINEKERFGSQNDFTAFKSLDGKSDDGLLWVNHESTRTSLISQYDGKSEKTREQVELEMDSVGGSINRIKKNQNGQWKLVENDPLNRRLHARTPIPFDWDAPVYGKNEAIGTLSNCAGGLTPWGTILTCEENYHDYWGERDFKTGDKKQEGLFQWEKYYDHPPEHYGWVVEVDLMTGDAKKLVGLGRCAHEAAAVHQEENGICVVYTGDDKVDECIYKFIGSEPNSLTRGTLYVADTVNGKWISLDINSNPLLQENFTDQTEVLVHVREAARLVGGTPQDRPEDVEIDPVSGNIFITLTNNKPKGNYHGSVLKIIEKNGDKLSLEFNSETFLAGGEETGFTCPDNIVFDKKGNLWFANDISDSEMNQPPYTQFKNNGLFYVPMSGPHAGQAVQVASGPVGCELTGPAFSPDYSTLFLCVQHPHKQWPDREMAIGHSAVVGIQGAALDALMS